MSRMRLGIVMDPIATITPAKDSSLAMLLEAGHRGYELHYFEQADLRLLDGKAFGRSRRLRVQDDLDDWYALDTEQEIPLAELDVILMRKDPPFDMEYIYTSYILERAAEQGVLVVNRPQALRDINEKVFTAWFPDCCPPTLITRSMEDMRSFASRHGRIVVKPLDGMGGRSIFVIEQGDNNSNVILETLTDYGRGFAMAQKHVPEISAGDKRILMVDGKPADYALARIPPPDDNRGNLVVGAQAEVRPLTERDRWICNQLGPTLRERGVIFAGLDVIGDYLTEINVTSPTGIRELQKYAEINVAADLMDSLNEKLGR